MTHFDDVRDLLVIKDGEAHCPVDDCDWWVPRGMEYGFLDHYRCHERWSKHEQISPHVKLMYESDQDRWIACYSRLLSDVCGYGSTREQALADLVHQVAMYQTDGSLLDDSE